MGDASTVTFEIRAEPLFDFQFITNAANRHDDSRSFRIFLDLVPKRMDMDIQSVKIEGILLSPHAAQHGRVPGESIGEWQILLASATPIVHPSSLHACRDPSGDSPPAILEVFELPGAVDEGAHGSSPSIAGGFVPKGRRPHRLPCLL